MQAIYQCVNDENMLKGEQKVLSLKENVERLKLQKSSTRSQCDLAGEFSITKTEVQVILTRKAEFLNHTSVVLSII